MDLILIRHAQPAWVKDGLGVNDPPLTDLGRRQAEQLAVIAAGWRNVAELWVSPTCRTRETAEPLARALGLEPRVVPDLREIRTPDWEGKPAEHVSRVFMESLARPPAEWWSGLPGGEDFHGFRRRVTTALDELLAGHGVRPRPRVPSIPALADIERTGSRLVLVGHGGTNSVVLEHLLGLDGVPWPWERFVSHHASVTRVRATPLGGGYIFGLFRFNDLAHIARPDRTR